MPTPIEDHGGAVPPAFHTRNLADVRPRLVIFVSVDPSENGIQFARIWNSLQLSQLDAVFLRIPSTMVTSSLPNLHPLVQYVNASYPIQTILKDLLRTEEDNIFYTEISSKTIVHPEFWQVFASATPGINIQFLDEQGTPHTLFSATLNGLAQTTHSLLKVAAYSSIEQDTERICDAAEYGLLTHTTRMLQELTINCSSAFTPLCQLATKYGTDKSPYNLYTHRHPYTPVYDMFFRPLKSRASLKVGEVGVLNGASIRMWQDYFVNPQIDAFDINEDYLQKIAGLNNVHCYKVDAGESRGLRASLKEACSSGRKYDILIEDASHRLEHQLIFLRDALDFVASGGVLVIEDIFREIPAARFEEVLQTCTEKVLYSVLVTPDHTYRWSPGWENDRVLFVWVR
jgi:hypothetical protein